MTLKAAVVESVEQTDAQLAGATALAGDASVMRFQAGGFGDCKALVHVSISMHSV